MEKEKQRKFTPLKPEDIEKYLNMSREEEIKELNEYINGSTYYGDMAIAFGYALMTAKKKQ